MSANSEMLKAARDAGCIVRDVTYFTIPHKQNPLNRVSLLFSVLDLYFERYPTLEYILKFLTKWHMKEQSEQDLHYFAISLSILRNKKCIKK